MAPNRLEPPSRLLSPCYALIRENYLPDKPNCLPVRLLFGAQLAQLRYLDSYLKRNGFRQIVAVRIAPKLREKRGKQGGSGRRGGIGA
jgi:hypothetical protein